MNQTRKERQLNEWLRKNREAAEEAQNKEERDYILFMLAGFLSGLRMTNAITKREYNAYYDELKSFMEKLEGKGEEVMV